MSKQMREAVSLSLEAKKAVRVLKIWVSSGVRGVLGTRVSDPAYEGIRSGVCGYQIRGMKVLVPGYKGIKSGVRGYYCLEYVTIRVRVRRY